mgnify:CR=1 FL=1
MNQITKALLIPVLLLVACGGANQAGDISIPETKVLARVESSPAITPTPTEVPVTVASVPLGPLGSKDWWEEIAPYITYLENSDLPRSTEDPMIWIRF